MNFNAVGRLTKDPESYSNPKGNYCKFCVAVKRPYVSPEVTDFYPCIAWGKQAEFIAKFFKKGNRIFLTGHITSSSYTVGGEKRTAYDWVIDNAEFCESKAEADTYQNQSTTPTYTDELPEKKEEESWQIIPLSDIPF